MAIAETVKRNWIQIQKRYEYPVNAIGVPIHQNDIRTLEVWRQEGIDRHVRKRSPNGSESRTPFAVGKRRATSAES